CQISSTNDIYLTSPNTKIGNNTYITDTTLTAPSILADDYNGLIINDTVFMNKSRVASYSQSSQSIPPTTDTVVFFDLPGPGPLVSYGIGRTITNFWKTRAPTAVWDIYYQIICQSFTQGYNARAHIQKIGSSIR